MYLVLYDTSFQLESQGKNTELTDFSDHYLQFFSGKEKSWLKPTFSLLLITAYLSLFSEVVFVNNVQFIVKFEYQWWEVWNFNIHDFVI